MSPTIQTHNVIKRILITVGCQEGKLMGRKSDCNEMKHVRKVTKENMNVKTHLQIFRNSSNLLKVLDLLMYNHYNLRRF